MGKDCQGKVAVVTGGSTGIGLALCNALAEEGMDIVVSSSNPKNLDVAKTEIEKKGGKVLAIPCDVTNRAQVYELAQQAKAEFGQIDLVCANAGATTVGRLVDHGDADWDWAIDLNFRGVTHCLQAFYPDMAERESGTIMMTSSQVALSPDWVFNHGPYVAAKAAVLGLGLSLRPEAAKHGVNISVLLPAGTETEIVTSKPRRVPDENGAEFEMNLAAPKIDEERPFFLSTDEVAQRAIAGLRRNDAMIITHGNARPLFEQWCDTINEAYKKADEFEIPVATNNLKTD